MDEFVRREIIMEHYQNPRNKKECHDDSYIKVNTSNASCIDNLDIFVKIDQGKIKDIIFNGEACAISTSSCSIMIESLIGKTIPEVQNFIENFEHMVNEEPYQEEILKEALAYQEIYKQNNRKNCALLPYKGMREILKKIKEDI